MPLATPSESRRLPRWVLPAVVVFWGGFLAALSVRFLWGRLHGLFVLLAISVFLSLAVEPGVNRLARRGWRRGTATALILFGVFATFLVFVVAIGTLVGSQIADLLSDSETYITDTVDTINDTFGTNLDAQEVIEDFNDPDGPVQEFIRDQRDEAVQLSVAALGGLLQLFSVLLFTFYLVADGPKMRRAICSRLTPARQELVLGHWELAGDKTGGYLYSRALLALLSTIFHWIVFQSLGTAAPVALALWVGIISQFLPGRRHVHRRHPARAADVPRLAAEGGHRARRHRHLPAGGELPPLAADHGHGRWSCTRRWRSARRSPAPPCSAPSVPCSPCRPRRWPRRSSATGVTATRSSRAS